jgi:hypothetical protein
MEKRRNLLCVVAIATTLVLNAQGTAKVESQESFDYNRSSLSVIAFTGLTGSADCDNAVVEWASTADFDGKFDMNKIKTVNINAINDTTDIKDALNQAGVGKQVLDYWVQYDGKKFNDELMSQRARYNATDADVLKDQANKVSTLDVANKGVLKQSYVMVAGPTKIEENINKKDGKVTYTATVYAHVYKLDLTDEMIDSIWANWLGEDATDAQRAQYDGVNVDLIYMASTKEKIGTGSTKDEAVKDALGEVLQPLEKKIDAWQVVTSIYQKHPLGAKIGKKEGLHNSDRYRAFKVVEDADGNLAYKKMGFVRATKVVDNAQNSTGESDCSQFYQISGRNLREGMFLKQKKDARISVSAYGVLDGFQVGGIDVDYLMHTSNSFGLMQYVGLSMGYFYDNDYDSNYIPMAINYGIGIHPVRILEIMPNIGVGADYYSASDDNNGYSSSSEDEESFMKKIAYFARAGVKVGLQIYYPVQIFARIDYAYKLSEGEQYVESSKERFEKISFGAGIKINF